ISMGHMFDVPLPDWLHPEHNPLFFALIQLALTLPVMYLGRNFYQRGFSTLFKLSPDMDSLVALGTMAAFLYSIYATLMVFLGHKMLVHHLYYESAAVVLTLISLGKYLESKAKGKTNRAIAQLMALTPPTALVIRNGVESEVPVSDVGLDETILVKPGTKIPLDGVVISGSTYVDEAMLTGESAPVKKEIGGFVIGGTINKNGSIKYQVKKIGADTMLAQIIALVEQAQGSKAPIARLADIISGYFVPTVMVLAVIGAAAWLLGGESFSFALTVFVAVLVIACPCALGLATPVSIVVASGRAAGSGVLFKSGEALENCAKVNIVLMDKTGTLTRGAPELTDVVTFNDYGENEVIKLAAAAERASEHPLAVAIVGGAKVRNIELPEVEDFQAVSGKGIHCRLGDKVILVGNADFQTENNLEMDVTITSRLTNLATQGKTPMIVSFDGKIIGILAVSDPIKEESAEVIRKLHKMNLQVMMLTGDNKLTAQAVADKLGVDKFFAELLPQNKSKILSDLRTRGEVVAMVGDGINDAPSLAAADVGIAIGNGTDIAIEAAAVILNGGDLHGLPRAFQIGRATMRNIKENLFWAFAYNVVCIPVAMGVLHLFGGPLLNPMIAGAAMSLSSVSVVSNALRLNWILRR
ncbi:MAG: copper-translocating P-type ATPase, partial [Victivallaceae bacterium]